MFSAVCYLADVFLILVCATFIVLLCLVCTNARTSKYFLILLNLVYLVLHVVLIINNILIH